MSYPEKPPVPSNTFVDLSGRTWMLEITAGALKRLREQVGFDLATLVKQKLAALVDLLDDPERFVGALWVLCEQQAARFGLTPEQFPEGFGGSTLEAAGNAFVEAIALFSRNPTRDLLRVWAKKHMEIETKTAKMGTAKLEEIDLDKMLADTINRADSNASAGSWPPSQASIPGLSRSAN